MKLHGYKFRLAMRSIGILAIAGSPSGAQEVGIDSPAHAKGIVVLKARFPSRGEVESFSLQVSSDGKQYADAKAGPRRGLPLSGALVRGANEAENTLLVVPVVGCFDLAPKGFLFGTPGTYHLKWDIVFGDKMLPSLQVEQTVEVGSPSPADLQFIARVGAENALGRACGGRAWDGATVEQLALAFIAELLERAESHPIEGIQCDPGLPCADELLKLAVELPESSYAPYAAYCAGGIYRACLERTPESRELSPTLRSNPLYKKADEALRFAANRGDSFLKPRALCALAYLRECSAAWDEADQLLTQAVEAASGQGTIQAIVFKLRRDLSNERKAQEKGGN